MDMSVGVGGHKGGYGVAVEVYWRREMGGAQMTLKET